MSGLPSAATSRSALTRAISSSPPSSAASTQRPSAQPVSLAGRMRPITCGPLPGRLSDSGCRHTPHHPTPAGITEEEMTLTKEEAAEKRGIDYRVLAGKANRAALLRGVELRRTRDAARAQRQGPQVRVTSS